jgi:hypothetical protein
LRVSRVGEGVGGAGNWEVKFCWESGSSFPSSVMRTDLRGSGKGAKRMRRLGERDPDRSGAGINGWCCWRMPWGWRWRRPDGRRTAVAMGKMGEKAHTAPFKHLATQRSITRSSSRPQIPDPSLPGVPLHVPPSSLTPEEPPATPRRPPGNLLSLSLISLPNAHDEHWMTQPST